MEHVILKASSVHVTIMKCHLSLPMRLPCIFSFTLINTPCLRNQRHDTHYLGCVTGLFPRQFLLFSRVVLFCCLLSAFLLLTSHLRKVWTTGAGTWFLARFCRNPTRRNLLKTFCSYPFSGSPLLPVLLVSRLDTVTSVHTMIWGRSNGWEEVKYSCLILNLTLTLCYSAK